MPASHRGSSKIDKQIVHIRATDFLRGHPGEIGLDVCCGPMLYRPFFRTQRYIGLDLDPKELALGHSTHPDAEIVEMSMFDMPGRVAGDTVCCVQAIGINQYFDDTRALDAVRALIGATRPHGALVFNIGRKVLGTAQGDAIVIETERLLRETFVHVQLDRIGLCEKNLGYPLIRYLVYPIGRLLTFCPRLYGLREPTYIVFTAWDKK